MHRPLSEGEKCPLGIRGTNRLPYIPLAASAGTFVLADNLPYLPFFVKNQKMTHFTLTKYQKSHILNAKAAAGDRRFALMYVLRNKPHFWRGAVYFFFVRSLTSSMTSTIRESNIITSVKDSLFIAPPPFRGRKAPSWDKRDEPPTVYSFGCLRRYYCTCRQSTIFDNDSQESNCTFPQCSHISH